jgi:hypothetical protein
MSDLERLSPLLAVAGVVVLLMPIVILRRRSRRRDAVQCRPVRIMVVGLPESGKTALLASMFRKLAFGGPDGVVVETDRDTTGRLLELTRGMEQRDVEIHPGTLVGDTTNYEFTFRVKNDRRGDQRPCSVSYLDYAGEHAGPLVRPGATEPAPEVLAAAKECDVLMAVLDGEKVLHMMQDNADPAFFTELGDLILLLIRAPQKAAHIIITKWDLLHPAHTVPDIVRRLDKFPPFHQFHEHRRSAVLRIIPVSSFGMNGYHVRDTDGVVHKDTKKETHWNPYNVATPLAFALGDVLRSDADRVGDGARGRRVSEFSSFFVTVGALLGVLTIKIPPLTFGVLQFSLKPNAVQHLLDLVNRPHEVNARRLQRHGMLPVLRFLNTLTAEGYSEELTNSPQRTA